MDTLSMKDYPETGHPQYEFSPLQTTLLSLFSTVHYHAHTLLLFTHDQILDTVIPGTAFGILAALSGPILDLPQQEITAVLWRLPSVAFWLWIVILQFCVQNERTPNSIKEDTINKPWRPIPSKRITQAQANYLLIGTHIISGCFSIYLGVSPIFLVYVCLITAYNDFGGGDHSGILRNLFCGAGFSCYFGGALKIALGKHVFMSMTASSWVILVTFGILATTIQTQEFRDEVGDRARGRRTLVIELGRKLALSTVVLAVSFWSLFIPLVFLEGNWTTAILPVVLGVGLIVTAMQALKEGDQKFDRMLYKFWCLWMFGFCTLPLMKTLLA